jgi:hypothetical protein
MIISGLDSLGPAKYALPIIGPLMAAKDMITNPKEWKSAGKQIPEMIASGIESTAPAPVDAVTGVAGDIRKRLPFSDARRGPLSELSTSGGALVQTIASGIEGEQGTLLSTMSQMLSTVPMEGLVPLGQQAPRRQVSQAGGMSANRRRPAQSGGRESRIEIVLEQTNEFNGTGQPGEIRRDVREATRSGGRDALSELELLLKQTLAEVE